MIHPKLLLFLCLCALVNGASQAHAQGDWELRGGLGLSGQFTVGSFVSPPGLPNPPDPLTLTSSNFSWRPVLSIGADVGVGVDSTFRIGGALQLSSTHMGYTASEQTIIATPDGGTRPASLQHDLTVSVTSLGLRPYARARIMEHLIVEVGIPLCIAVNSQYHQTMRFTDPPNLTFVDGSLEQVTGSGSLPGGSSLVVALDVNAEWLVPLTDRWQLTPSIGVSTNLTSWHNAAPMRTVNITPGIGVRYRPWISEPSMVYDTTFVRDTVVILTTRVRADSTELVQRAAESFPGLDTIRTIVTEHYRTFVPKPPSVLRASLRLFFENADGTLSRDASLRVSTVRRTRIVPVLPLVVFDEDAEQIPTRYVQLDQQSAQKWTVDMALTNSTHWQYQVMNIAGARLRANSGTSVQLIAYDDGTPEGKVIAQTRVKNVKKYLSSAFNVPDRQISIDVRNGQRSQQPWVFIVDTTRRVLAPIQATETITESRLPRVRITPEVVSEVGVRSWILTMAQDSKQVKRDSGSGTVPATLIWDMNESVEPQQAFVAPISIQLHVTDVEGTQAQSELGLVTLKESATTDRSLSQQTRTEVLRWIGPDYLHTPDVDLFGVAPSFTHIDVYPSSSRRSDFFLVDAPATVHPVGVNVWFREGLQEPERTLFDHAEVYTKESR